ncbi:protein BREAKING OF ASYMMETRY IN THE STOMATAL LINEAGE [Juglans microcarpa x Juglans regia]|uniref:protein BREAKING OF ASYMMETRY IN THE STOMATAL LINEAGE n=1 Tax=Juglans microcarpa x Juglans regia TaxID=2249226 RepID=UPI001B7E1B1D|nr:protein BREAKING OF ASYMMETRY IN THE STOMATAL LINEAGE [Juglans microcarpa x Juglans regia]
MCTPWTIPKLVRWRVRDWVSCFLACRFPLDDESNDTYRSSAPQKLPRKNMGFDTKAGTDQSRVMNQSSKKKSRHKSRRSKERQSKLSSAQTKDDITVENGSVDDSCWPNFSDEDYIVFCFREDGAFDVVKDGKPETSNRFDCMSRSSRTVNRKDDEEEDCIYWDTESPRNSIRRRSSLMEDQVEDRGLVSVESSESNQSDRSTGSFAFPVLGWEWMGSPVQMPKSEGLQLRKHKARCVGFQCFRN